MTQSKSKPFIPILHYTCLLYSISHMNQGLQSHILNKEHLWKQNLEIYMEKQKLCLIPFLPKVIPCDLI